VGRAVSLHPLQTVTASGSLPISAPKSITPETGRQLSAQFWIVPKSAPASSQEPAVRHAVRQAVLDAASHNWSRGGKVEKAEKADKADHGKDKVSRRGDDSGPGSDSPGQSLDGLSQSKKLADGASALDDKKIKDKLDDKIIKTKLDGADAMIPAPRLVETTVRPPKAEKPEKK
jgi:hypothetical protein